MTTKLRIAKHDGRWHVYMMWTDIAMGPTMGCPVGIGWSSFDLARKSAINFLAIAKAVHLIEQQPNNNRRQRPRRKHVVAVSD